VRHEAGSLKNNTPRKQAGIVKSMEYYLFSDHHKAWLAAIIDSRDRMNHCQAVPRAAVQKDRAVGQQPGFQVVPAPVPGSRSWAATHSRVACS
jgi:hypothetical protein